MNDYRSNAINLKSQKVLFANLLDTAESEDQYHQINCEGFGRIRSFSNFSMHLETDVLPKRKFNRVGSVAGAYTSQVFQIAICDFHCWYCFVDKSNRSGGNMFSQYLSADELLALCVENGEYPKNIDISGGSPDLVPEFIIWMLEAVEQRGLKGKISIWVDSNLNSKFYETCLSNHNLDYISGFPNFRFLCSLKGWDEESAYYNSGLPGTFKQQLDCLHFFVRHKMNLFLYITLVSSSTPTEKDLRKLFDLLYGIDKDLPTYTIPLGIKPFHAVTGKAKRDLIDSWNSQVNCAKIWDTILLEHYNANYILDKFK